MPNRAEGSGPLPQVILYCFDADFDGSLPRVTVTVTLAEWFVPFVLPGGCLKDQVKPPLLSAVPVFVFLLPSGNLTTIVTWTFGAVTTVTVCFWPTLMLPCVSLTLTVSGAAAPIQELVAGSYASTVPTALLPPSDPPMA